MTLLPSSSPTPSLLRHPKVLLGAGIGFVLVVVVSYLSLRPEEKAETAYHEVVRSDFLVTIVEGGTLEAVRDVVVRNEVEGTSRIIEIVPEGTYVTNGQLLVELDTGEAEDSVNTQEIAYEKAKAAFILAEKDLEIQRSLNQSSVDAAALKVRFADIDLQKFLRGDMVKEFREAEISITTEMSKLLLAKDNLEWSEQLFEQGFETKNVVDKGKNEVLALELKVESAQTNLWVLTNFTHPKMIEQYQSDLEEARKELGRVKAQGEGKLAQLEADLITQSNSLQLTFRKLEDDKKQLENSRIYAPQDGLVVYVVSRSRWSSQSMIEEGATVRNRQEIIKLPDTSEMKVEVKVHESHVSKVHPGLPAFVVLDSAPDRRFPAAVTKVAVLPDTQSRFGNPNLKVYKTEIILTETLEDIKPGVSARAEIVITNIPNTITVPIQAITTLKGQTVAFVKQGSTDEPVPVQVGMFNTKSIEILSGLNEGDLVLLSPPYDMDEKDLGGAIITESDSIPKVELKPGTEVTAPNRTENQPTERRDGDGRDRRSSGRGREEMMKRFDKNGNGKIDADERDAMRKAFGNRQSGGSGRSREGGGRSGGGGGGGGGRPDRGP